MSKRAILNQKVRHAVISAHNRTCFYCTDTAQHVDHIVSVANGGTNDLCNLIAACPSCNSRKSRTNLPDELLADALNAARQALPVVLSILAKETKTVESPHGVGSFKSRIPLGKTAMVAIRMTSEQRTLIREQASKSGVSVTAWIESVIEGALP